MKLTNDRTAFYGVLGETIDIYQAEQAVAAVFHKMGGRAGLRSGRQKVTVGHDGSPSSDMMEAAVCAALCAAGADVVRLGAVPTGAVSCVTAGTDALIGVMITGNTFDPEVSGLKFFRSNGKPLLGEPLQAILAGIDRHISLSGKHAGRIRTADEAARMLYADNLLDAAGGTVFESLRVALDCRRSAAEAFAAPLFARLGAEVSVRRPSPDEDEQPGFACPANLSEWTRATGSDVGFAFSAAGEQCLVCDAEGALYDSEKLVAIFGHVYGTLAASGEERQPVLLGDSCHVALAPYLLSAGADCRLVTGDYSYLAGEFLRYEAANPEKGGVMMAADRTSGPVFPRRSFVPDGLMTAVMLLACMNRMGLSLAELARDVPRLIRNTSGVVIPTGAYLPLLQSMKLQEKIQVLRSYLSGDGRVNVFKSSPTDNRVEIIVEGVRPGQVARVAQMAERLVRKNLRTEDGTEFLEPPPYGMNEPKPTGYEQAVDSYLQEAEDGEDDMTEEGQETV